jgi:hypothetical protein
MSFNGGRQTMKKFSIYFLALFAAFALNIAYSVDHSNAMMGGPGSGQNGGNWPNQGMMNGAPMMTNNGGFGMMNGMDAAPAVGTDGTVYVTTYNRVSKNKTLRSGSFKSTISAIGPSGQTTAFTMNGIVSRPVLSDTTLFATASLPDTNDFQMVGNYAGTAPQPVRCFSLLRSRALICSDYRGGGIQIIFLLNEANCLSRYRIIFRKSQQSNELYPGISFANYYM